MKKVRTYKEKRQMALREKITNRRLWVIFSLLILTSLLVAFLNLKYYEGQSRLLFEISFWLFFLAIALGITTSLVQLSQWIDRKIKERKGQIVFKS